MLRAPSIRLFSGEWVGNLNSQSVLFIGSGAYFSGVEGPASLSDDFPHELRIHPTRKPPSSCAANRGRHREPSTDAVILSGAYFSGVEGPAFSSDDFPHELRIHPARKPRRNRFLRTKAVRPGQSSQGNQAHFVKSPHIYFHLSRMVFIP